MAVNLTAAHFLPLSPDVDNRDPGFDRSAFKIHLLLWLSQTVVEQQAHVPLAAL